MKRLMLAAVCVMTLFGLTPADAQASNTLWTRTYGSAPAHDPCFMVSTTPDGGYLLSRSGNEDFWLIKMEPETTPCPPTTLPFLDNFDSPTLEPCWSWVREDAGLWSLSERPGWMRLRTNGNFHQPQSNTTRSIPLRSFADEDMFIETKVDFAIDNCSGAGLLFYKDDDNFVDVMVIEEAEPNLQGIVSHNEINNVHDGRSALFLDWRPAYLRIVKIGDHYTAHASPDSTNWTVIGDWINDLVVDGVIQCGLYAMDCDQNLYYPADFDYFRADADDILPVELYSFNASLVMNAIRLEFSTASETNNDYFEIWRSESADGSFNRITILLSQGNTASGHSYEYVDRQVTEGQVYWYFLTDVDLSGSRTEHRDWMASASVTAHSIPTEYSLTAYPNPFNPTTQIRFDLPEESLIQLLIYNALGQQVATLLSEVRPAGSFHVEWNGKDDIGTELPSGVYICKIQADHLSNALKLLLMR